MTEKAWPSEWLRGVLGPAVLSIVAEGETYGYLVAQRLEQAGLGTIKGGTLYPLLNRYETDGLLASTWREGDGGPGRKYFRLTPRGRAELLRLRAGWTEFSAVAGAAVAGTAVAGTAVTGTDVTGTDVTGTDVTTADVTTAAATTDRRPRRGAAR